MGYLQTGRSRSSPSKDGHLVESVLNKQLKHVERCRHSSASDLAGGTAAGPFNAGSVPECFGALGYLECLDCPSRESPKAAPAIPAMGSCRAFSTELLL